MTPDEVRELESSMAEIWALAQSMGLDPFPTHFELVPASIMYEFGAYGIPGRFSHWTHGRAYQQIKTMYDYGLSKIYELVINTNPAYAFLLENNTVLQNKLVVAHVLAHVDFFKNNVYFRATNRGMLEATSVNAERLRRYAFEHGRDEVERVLDAVLSIQEHVDAHPSLRARPSSDDTKPKTRDARAGPFDDLIFIGSNRRPEATVPERKFPPEPEKDLLLFIAEHAPELEPWERDIVHIVRSEQMYFLPQMKTKVMNEGWASYWHARIMREMDLPHDDYVEFARLHSGVLSPSRRSINPYYVGMKIFEDIERRWDEPTDEERERLGRTGGQGRAKIFEVRELDNDESFLRNYLTKDLVEELDLYLYRLEDDTWVIVEKDWEVVRDSILTSLTNFGQPYVVVEDGDHRRNRELLLKHCFDGQELDLGYADKTLRHVRRLWGRPVHLETVVDGKPTTFAVDDERSRTVMVPR